MVCREKKQLVENVEIFFAEKMSLIHRHQKFPPLADTITDGTEQLSWSDGPGIRSGNIGTGSLAECLSKGGQRLPSFMDQGDIPVIWQDSLQPQQQLAFANPFFPGDNNDPLATNNGRA